MFHLKHVFIVLPLLVFVNSVSAAPSGYYPDDWTSENIMEYLVNAEYQRQLRPHEDEDFNTDNTGLGMVSGVDVDSNGDLYVFHRANRPWTAKTFEGFTDVLSKEGKARIKRDTIYKMNPRTGKFIKSFGGDEFNVPHGLTIDKDDNIWLTDVGRHQVLRIPKGSTKPDMVFGEEFVPGDDDKHFCKPTDVAVASNGDFFVSDGYCNSRIMKFSKGGELKAKWGMPANQRQVTTKGPDPFTLNVPHSITLIEELDIVCVADRENERALCYNAGLSSNRKEGSFNRTLIPQGDVGKIFAIAYNEVAKDVVATVEIARSPIQIQGMQYNPPRALTYGLNGNEKTEWAYITNTVARQGPSIFHDVCVSADGNDFFMADIVQRRVLKYTNRKPAFAG